VVGHVVAVALDVVALDVVVVVVVLVAVELLVVWPVVSVVDVAAVADRRVVVDRRVVAFEFVQISVVCWRQPLVSLSAVDAVVVVVDAVVVVEDVVVEPTSIVDVVVVLEQAERDVERRSCHQFSVVSLDQRWRWHVALRQVDHPLAQLDVVVVVVVVVDARRQARD
jgi:hypothetical protein